MEVKSTTALTKEAKIRGPYIKAALNPDAPRLQAMLAGAQRTILEIGCGEKPRMSWNLGRADAWVGADPAIRSTNESVFVHKGTNSITPDAKVVVFSDIVADIPKFQPDILLAVAPNQKDIADGKIFDDGLERFLSSEKQQTFVIVLDTRTREAEGYQGSARGVINTWMRENGFVRNTEGNADIDGFSPNSADLGGRNISMTFVRNP